MANLGNKTLGLEPFNVDIDINENIDWYKPTKKFLKSVLNMETQAGTTLKIMKVKNLGSATGNNLAIFVTVSELEYWLHKNHGYDTTKREFYWDEMKQVREAVKMVCREGWKTK
jgi:hypothetical protein